MSKKDASKPATVTRSKRSSSYDWAVKPSKPLKHLRGGIRKPCLVCQRIVRFKRSNQQPVWHRRGSGRKWCEASPNYRPRVPRTQG